MKNLIKVERARPGLTQDELTDQLKVSRQTINSVELEKFVPSTVLSLKIAAFFKVKFEDLFIPEEKDREKL